MISLGLGTPTDHNARAGRNLAIESATENHAETHYKKAKQSGVFGSGGVGFTLGSKMLSTDQQGTGTSAAASTVGSTSGSVVLEAGEPCRQVGSKQLKGVTHYSIIQGSNETTFYVLAVYFGSVNINKTRYAVACGLIADAVGLVGAITIGYLFYH